MIYEEEKKADYRRFKQKFRVKKSRFRLRKERNNKEIQEELKDDIIKSIRNLFKLEKVNKAKIKKETKVNIVKI